MLGSLSRKYLKHYEGLSYEAWLGITIYLLESSLMGVFYFLSIYFVNELHFSIATVGSIVSFYGLGAIGGGYLGGKLSDRLSPMRIAISSLLIQALAYSMLLYLYDIHFLMIDMIVLGFSSYGFITSCQLWVLQQCQIESQKIKALNLLATASNLGLAISAVLVSHFAPYGFKTIFIATGIGFLLLASCLFNFKNTSTQSITKVSSTLSQTKHNYIALACVFFVGMIVSQLGSTYAIFIQQSFPAFGIQAVSILFFLNSLLVVLFGTPVGNYVNQYNKMAIVGIGGFLIGFSMLMLALYPSFQFAVLACAVYTLGEILFFCMAQYVCYQAGSDDNKGQHLGMFRMVYASSRIAGPPLGSVIYQALGANALWYSCGLVGFLCLFACLLKKKRSILIISNQS